jgi:hypothetical protein
MRRFPSWPSPRSSPKVVQASAYRALAFYLQSTPPLRRLKHAHDTDAPGTNPAAVAVPALVSIFILRVPWVSSFHCVANHVSRWGRQALLLDSEK